MAAAATGHDRGARRSHALRIAGGALIAIVAAWIVAWIAASWIVDEGFVERRLADAASRHLGPHRATVGEVSVLPLRFGLSVDSLGLEPEPRHRGGGIELLVPEAVLTGIRPWSLAGGALEAGQLTLIRPGLASPTDSGSEATGSRRPTAAGSVGPPGAPAWFAPGRQAGEGGGGMRLGSLRIEGGTLDLGLLVPGALTGGVAHGVDLELDALAFGTREGSSTGRPSLAALARLRIDRYRGASSDGRHSLELEGVRADRETGRAEIRRALLQEVSREVVDRPESEGGPLALDDTTAVRAGPIVLEGLRLDGSAPGAPATARSLLVDSLRIEAVEGITGKSRPGPPEPSTTPVQKLRSLGLRLRIDSARVRNGSVVYRERRLGAARAGEIRFETLEGTVRPFPLGESSEDAAGDTVTATARARVNGGAPLWLSLRFPPDAEGFTFAADAGVADLEVATLNSILRPVEGVEIRGGRLDSLTFSVRVDRGRARGRAVPYYRGLSLSLEDASSGSQGVMEWAKGLLVDLQLNEDNLPSEGEDFRSAAIDLRAEPGTTLWEFLWDCLSQGLKSVTGT